MLKVPDGSIEQPDGQPLPLLTVAKTRRHMKAWSKTPT
jgi:hypothetical protein